MIIVGCDLHTRFQQFAMLNPTTGEFLERRLEHENGAVSDQTCQSQLSTFQPLTCKVQYTCAINRG